MSAGSNVPPGGQPLPVPSSGGGAPTAAPAKNNKKWLWVALGCGGCAVVGGIAVVVLGLFGLVAVKRASDGAAISSSVSAASWTSPAKTCSETCSRVISCEKKQAAAEPDAGYAVETQSDCEKDCGGNLQDEPYHCLSQALSCDDQEGCESGD